MSERRSEVKEIYNVGWYRKQFTLEPEWKEKRIWVEFEGVFRDAMVWVNGVYLDRQNSGYTGFSLELTDHLVWDTDNSITVRADSDQAEGWWYEGSGIYRNVYLMIGEPTYFKYNTTVLRPETDGSIYAEAVLVNDVHTYSRQNTIWRIKDADGAEVAVGEILAELVPYGETKIETTLKIREPKLRSPDSPYLYTFEIEAGNEQTSVTFGIRSLSFDDVPAKAPNALSKRFDRIVREEKCEGYEDDFRLRATYSYSMKEQEPTVYTAKLYNAESYEYIEFERLGSVTEIYLNGEKIGDTLRTHGTHTRNTIRPYRFYTKFAKGENELKVVSIGTESDPPAMSGYVKLGKMVVKLWKGKLHYGKARVFVKSDTPEKVVLSVTIKK